MAVYKRSYKRYDGALTDPLLRFTILPRYSFQSTFESKGFTVFFVVCFIPSLIGLLFLYFRANADILTSVGLPALSGVLQIDSRFFMAIFRVQCFLTFVLATFVGPGLVSPDLTNNALPLYLSRPFSRYEYVLGKLSVVATLASLITWVPGLILFLIQSNLESGWMIPHMRIAAAIFVGSWIWILMVSLMSIALSAWVKWKPVAAASMFGVYFVAGVFGELSNEILEFDTPWGMLLDVTAVMVMIWNWLFDGITVYRSMHVSAGFVSVAAFCAASLFMLWKKIRACEVVR